MNPTLYDIRALAATAAQYDLALTQEHVAGALSTSPTAALEATWRGVAAGLFRARKLPGFGNRLIFQPTARAIGVASPAAPTSLRKSAADDALRRSLMRAEIYFARPLSWLPRGENAALCERYGVPLRGHAPALIGLDGSHFHVFQPVLTEAGKSPDAALESTISRFFALLESGVATLHFATFSGRSFDAVQAALSALAPTSTLDAARLELASIDAAIAADGTRMFELVERRTELRREIDTTPVDDLFPWLNRKVIEVTL